MGEPLREILISGLPEAQARAVVARLAGPDLPEEGTELERDLAAQTKAWWEGEQTAEAAHPGDLRVEDIVALLLRKARSTVLARALIQLPPRPGAEVVHRIATRDLALVPHRIEADEPGVFFWRLRELLGIESLKPDPGHTGRAVRALAPAKARQVLSELHRIDPVALEEVRDLAYPFEDLMQLSDAELQMTLMGVDNRQVAISLKGVSSPVRNRILQCLSDRRKKVVEEEEGLAGEVSERGSLRAQARVLDRGRLLYEDGRLHTYLGSIDDSAGQVAAFRKAREAVYNRHMAWVRQWGRRAGQARGQSIGTAVAAGLILLAGGILIGRLRLAVKPGGGDVSEAGRPREARREAGPSRESSPVPSAIPAPLEAGGLRFSVILGRGLEPLGPGTAGSEGARIRGGAARVLISDPSARLVTPVAVIGGEAGAAYRVEVGPDSTLRVTALRGDLQVLGPGGAPIARIGTGKVAVLRRGQVIVQAGTADAEDLAWLEENR